VDLVDQFFCPICIESQCIHLFVKSTRSDTSNLRKPTIIVEDNI